MLVARGRLCASAAQVGQAALAANGPRVGVPAEGPIRSANTGSMIASNRTGIATGAVQRVANLPVLREPRQRLQGIGRPRAVASDQDYQRSEGQRDVAVGRERRQVQLRDAVAAHAVRVEALCGLEAAFQQRTRTLIEQEYVGGSADKRPAGTAT